jgi:ABC-type uncharacterized transport system involved in gliding motility auxiliary subunit
MNRRQVLLQQAISAALFVAVLVMLGWLSNRYVAEADWTAGNRRTLTEPTRKLLAAMPEPIAFKVFAYAGSDSRRTLENDLERYRRIKPDITIEFIDPSANPQKVRDYNVQRPGEAVAEYQGRRENLTATTEQAITAALQRLAHGGERWIVFLEGHGERAVNDTEQGGLSEFAAFLRDKGLQVRGLNLATDPRIPDNTSVLVLASPAKPLLEGEAKIVDDYVKGGGNLLWLADPGSGRVDPVTSLGALAGTLGVSWQKGTGILLESEQLGLPPFVYITTQYPPNPVTQDFPENALFPLVRGLTFKSDAADGWKVQPLLTTSEQAWLETGAIEGQVTLDPAKGDVQGPLTLGITLTRDAKKPSTAEPAVPEAPEKPAAAQRVAVIGDSDFVSNAYVGQLGNGLLGLNLAQWLTSQDAQLNIDVPLAPDRDFDLSRLGGIWGLYAIYLLFFAVLPLAFLGFGVTRWYVRRRA